MNNDIWLSGHPILSKKIIKLGSKRKKQNTELCSKTLYQGHGMLVDNPELSLLRSGCVLIVTDSHSLIQFSPQSVDIDHLEVSLPVLQTNLAQKLFHHHPVHKLSPLRSLIPLEPVTCKLEHISVTDQLQKTHASAWILSLKNKMIGSWQAVVLRERRGFEQSYGLLADFFKNYDYVPIKWHKKLRMHPLVPKSPKCISDNLSSYDCACQWLYQFTEAAQSNIQGVCEDLDTEYLHQYRINLRKARSVISLLKGTFDLASSEQLKDTFSTLMSLSGKLRDLDVYLLAEAEYREVLPETLNSVVDVFFDYIRTQRKTVLEQVRQSLSANETKQKFKKLLSQLKNAKFAGGKHAKCPIVSVGAFHLQRHISKTLKKALIIQPDTPNNQVHELRIACKKLRYLTELMVPVMVDSELDQFSKQMKFMTQSLGDFNDQSVQIEFLVSLAEQPDIPTDMALAIGALILICERRQHQARVEIDQHIALLTETLGSQTLHQILAE